MTEQEAMRIVKDEQLTHFNWFGHHSVRPNEVEINKRDDVWTVATADERGNRISAISYTSESEALEDFIERVRADKALGQFNR